MKVASALEGLRLYEEGCAGASERSTLRVDQMLVKDASHTSSQVPIPFSATTTTTMIIRRLMIIIRRMIIICMMMIMKMLMVEVWAAAVIVLVVVEWASWHE